MVESARAGPAGRQLQRRERILRAAAEVFFDSGFAGSIDDVIAKVGCSKRTVYTYFGNKDALFAAMVKSVTVRALSPLAREPSAGGTLEATLAEIGRRYLDVIMSPAALALYRVVVAEGARFPRLSRAFFENGPGRASACLAAALKARRAAWHIKVKDRARAAEQFFGMLRDLMHLRVVLGLRAPPSRAEADRAVAQAVAIFVHGCCRQTSARKRRR